MKGTGLREGHNGIYHRRKMMTSAIKLSTAEVHVATK